MNFLSGKPLRKNAAISLAMNFVPGIGFAGNMKEFWDAFQDGRSWIGLLQPPKKLTLDYQHSACSQATVRLLIKKYE